MCPEINIAKNLNPNGVEGASFNKPKNWFDEILRCGRRRRNVKSILAGVYSGKVMRSYSAQDDNHFKSRNKFLYNTTITWEVKIR
ncbi:MAG: hypothetical protein K8T10_02895 [Candidatus Eremiobacteraeota bacterium]|nr:hypothetical protein [Candidatus Eremiobacteraeota bacterium]